MSNWNDLLQELGTSGSQYDICRRKYLSQLNNYTKRNTVIYYSGWLQKPNAPKPHINDSDKTGFMSVFDKLDTSKGLDLFLHTPGGDTAATESIVSYMRSLFNNDIRAIVPELAMSAGTMISCATKEIVMGLHSSLGPIDPQFNGIPAHGIIEEFEEALASIASDPSTIPAWQVIISKYNPTLIGECRKAVEWSEEMVKHWLTTCMFKSMRNQTKKKQTIDKIVKELGDHSLTKSHARHLSRDKCKSLGIKIFELESDSKLKNLVLSVHHAAIHTLTDTPAFKIIENHNGVAYINIGKEVLVR